MTDRGILHRRIEAFLTIGADELRAAGLLAPSLPRQATFQAQQAVEKLLRAVIEAEGRRAGPTHNIRELAAILGQAHALYPDFLAFDELSPAATRYRYPGGSGSLARPPDDDELNQWLREIAALQTKVIRFLEERQLYPKGP